MSRLIDADLLIEEMRKWYWDKEKQDAAKNDVSLMDLFTNLAITTVEEQPTAFELKNVIEQLEILRVKTTEDSCPGAECERCVYSDICKDVSCADVYALDSAIEIVKRGRRDEE